MIISLSRQLSARVLQQAGVTAGPSAAAAAADDSLAVDAGPFGVPEAAAGLPAPAAVAAAAAAEQPGASVVVVPGGGCVVVGSDVAPGSPPSSFTLSTHNSTEAGMSMTTAGLSTPPASGTTWEGQVGSFGSKMLLATAAVQRCQTAAAGLCGFVGIIQVLSVHFSGWFFYDATCCIL
jgi:hypothetical protein